jgi:diguanylate cyclase (GGDEF)-like protein/PAS domain S-box-containing protein
LDFVSDAPPIDRQSFDELLGPVRVLVAQLTRSAALERGDVEGAMKQLTEASTLALRVDRASVWCFDRGDSELHCLDLFERHIAKHSRGASISRADAPRYFDALASERTIATSDALDDPRTSELAEGYLDRLGIGAMLDAPILLEGKLVGVVCHEHLGGPRDWKPWEELIAGTFADFAAMVLGAAERAEQARALESMRQSRETLQILFDAAPVPLVLTGLTDGVIVSCNHGAAQMFGTTPGEMVGRRATDFYRDPGERRTFLDTLLREGRVDGFVTELKTFDDSPLWVQLSARALTLGEEQVFMVGFADLTAQKRVEAQLRELATTDPLTGALNRRRLFEIAEEELGRSARYARPLALAMLDLDHFKAVNDDFGHLVGDEALRAVAVAVRTALRRQDHASRYGGEEFVVLLPETTLDGARQVVERMREEVAALRIARTAGDVRITMSAGVVAYREGESFDSMLNRADDALYEAKEAGRNRVVAVP